MVDINQYENGEIFSPLQKELVAVLQHRGPMTRAELVTTLAKPRTTIYDNILGLIAHGIVSKYSRPQNKQARPLVYFKIVG